MFGDVLLTGVDDLLDGGGPAPLPQGRYGRCGFL
ncbi:hypothetical protein SMALA_8404 [Streptomyces malaysiensis subsp. malaysiensis]|nr:hypothetical protein SMALA_8404 [Streptomyces malaysiensis]